MEEKEEKEIKSRLILSFILGFFYIVLFQQEMTEELWPAVSEFLMFFIAASIIMYIVVSVLEGTWFIAKEICRRFNNKKIVG